MLSNSIGRFLLDLEQAFRGAGPLAGAFARGVELAAARPGAGFLQYTQKSAAIEQGALLRQTCHPHLPAVA